MIVYVLCDWLTGLCFWLCIDYLCLARKNTGFGYMNFEHFYSRRIQKKWIWIKIPSPLARNKENQKVCWMIDPSPLALGRISWFIDWLGHIPSPLALAVARATTGPNPIPKGRPLFKRWNNKFFGLENAFLRLWLSLSLRPQPTLTLALTGVYYLKCGITIFFEFWTGEHIPSPLARKTHHNRP